MSANEKAYIVVNEQEPALDYSKIAQSASFQTLIRVKRNFILPFSMFFLAFYFTLPVLTAYSNILNQAAFGAITWAWIFAFAQFIMTWSLCSIYSRKAEQFDQLVEVIIEESKN